MQNGSFLKFESDFQKFLPIFLSNLDCVLSTKSMEISISPFQKKPVFKSSKSNSWVFWPYVTFSQRKSLISHWKTIYYNDNYYNYSYYNHYYSYSYYIHYHYNYYYIIIIITIIIVMIIFVIIIITGSFWKGN